MANRATSGLERSPPRRTDRHRSDQDKRLGVVRGREGTTDVPTAEGSQGNGIGRVRTGSVGRDVVRQHRHEGNTAAGRAVAVGQTRGLGTNRRVSGFPSGIDRVRRICRSVTGQPIAAARLGSAASQVEGGERHQQADKSAHCESRCEGSDDTTHGTKTRDQAGTTDSLKTPVEQIGPRLQEL